MAAYKGLTEIILTNIDNRLKQITFPITSAASIQAGQYIPPSNRISFVTGYFQWGVSTWGLATISPIYKPEQPTKPS